MDERQRQFRGPPKKFQPKGVTILYEDRDILVVDKVSGLLTVSTDKVRENTAYYILTDYVRRGIPKSRNRIFIVHRLDRDTSGVLVFAKTEQAKHYLQDQWQSFSKQYYAVVHGTFAAKEGVITSYLAENSVHKMYSVDDAERGKLAMTGYKVVRESNKFSLLEIDLLTGRKNQIRVHMAERGCPVAGDNAYGRKGMGIKRLALHAFSLTIAHPFSHQDMTFEAKVPGYFKTLMNSE